VGGIRHKRSGGLSAKGDLTVGIFKADVKSTSKDSIRITKAMLKKISDEAFAAGKEPAIVIDFGENESWWVIRARNIGHINF